MKEKILFFNFSTNYFFNNKIEDLKSFTLSDSDFNSFKSYLKQNGFNFETKTEQAFNEALEVAKEEELNTSINSEYAKLVKALNDYKNSAIDDNKAKLSSLLTDQIIKRYFYSEGLYDYYTANNLEIKTALELLNNPTEYKKILN